MALIVMQQKPFVGCFSLDRGVEAVIGFTMPTKGKLLFTDVSIVNSIAWCAHSKLKGSQQQRQGRALGRRYRRRIFCCPTELISRYFDKIMAPIERSLPSYITDSQHALEIFNDFNLMCKDKLILTMDITSLYTFLPNGEGVLALKHLFFFIIQALLKNQARKHCSAWLNQC